MEHSFVDPGGTLNVDDVVLLAKDARIVGRVRNEFGVGVQTSYSAPGPLSSASASFTLISPRSSIFKTSGRFPRIIEKIPS